MFNVYAGLISLQIVRELFIEFTVMFEASQI